MALSPELFTPRCASPSDVSCLRAESGRMTLSTPCGSYINAPQWGDSMLTLNFCLHYSICTAW